MKVATITIQRINNYGSVLQSYATQHIFQQLGCEHVVIDYMRPGLASYQDFMEYALKRSGAWDKNELTRMIYRVIKKPSYHRQEHVFSTFLEENVRLTEKKYYSFEDLLDDPPQADIYCTGSDQTWNSEYNGGVDLAFFLAFKEHIQRIAFSASIGYNTFSNADGNMIIPYLKKYQAISVRESSAKKELELLGFKNVEHTLDPTLMLKSADWDKFTTNDKIGKKYLLVYQLNPSKDFDRFAEQIAKSKNLKMVRICNLYDHCIRGGKPVLIPEVPEWLTLIKNAALVITDSFHGTAFSINFGRQFYVYYPPKFSTRLQSILELFGLQERVLNDVGQTLNKGEIDYEIVNKKLERERKKTWNYLRKAIGGRNENFCGDDNL